MAVKKQPVTRLIKSLPKGQITIPIAFRRELGIEENTILGVTLKEDKIEISPLRTAENEPVPREYSGAKIREFLKEDRLDKKTAARVLRKHFMTVSLRQANLGVVIQTPGDFLRQWISKH